MIYIIYNFHSSVHKKEIYEQSLEILVERSFNITSLFTIASVIGVEACIPTFILYGICTFPTPYTSYDDVQYISWIFLFILREKNILELPKLLFIFQLYLKILRNDNEATHILFLCVKLYTCIFLSKISFKLLISKLKICKNNHLIKKK